MRDPSTEPYPSPVNNLAERDPGPLPELPLVEPPSAGFVVQLFVIPALVVVVVIIVWLLFGKLAGGERDAMEYVRRLRSPAANWRYAFELASLIQHDARIGSDPVLLGELTDLLAHELDKPEDDPELTQYVALTLGAFKTLEAQTESGQSVDPMVPLARALDPRYQAKIRIAAAASMAKQAARNNGGLEDATAVKALGAAAAGGDPEVRQMAVYSLGFFGERAAQDLLRERIQMDDDRFMRYNAGGCAGPSRRPGRHGTIREMLSTSDLNKVIDLQGTTEKQNKIEAIELEAIEALRTVGHGRSAGSPKGSALRIADLTHSGLVSVRSQALELLQNLQGKA